MALNDVKLIYSPYASNPTREFVVEDRTTSSDTVMYAGEPVKINGQGANYVVHLATGDPEYGTDIMAGITATGSTETSTVDGVVQVILPMEGMIWRCKATDSTALAAGVLYDCVTFDLTGTTYTVDEDEGSDENVHGLRIMGYDSDAGTVDFLIKSQVTLFDDLV
jgi:hypothetical protein